MRGESKDSSLRKKGIPEGASEHVVESRKREARSAKHAGASHFCQVMTDLCKERKKHEVILCMASHPTKGTLLGHWCVYHVE